MKCVNNIGYKPKQTLKCVLSLSGLRPTLSRQLTALNFYMLQRLSVVLAFNQPDTNWRHYRRRNLN